jgi:gamma-butyrobetaine dioxygenase
MEIISIDSSDRSFIITWADQTVSEFPYIWLRDNDQDELHPHTRERIFNLTSVSLDLQPESFELTDESVNVRWSDRADSSIYPAKWLFEHQPGKSRTDPSIVTLELWDRDTIGMVPRASAKECIMSEMALHKALLTLKQKGILVFYDLEDRLQASDKIGKLIGFRRQTNFGDHFEVVSMPEPNNLAYTSLELPLHTDLPNQELIPGFQFLHALRNSATGGESVFADGFRICADLKNDSPAIYELLSTVHLPWRFHDNENDIRYSRPIINVDFDGGFDSFVFNTHIADIPDLSADQLYEFYAAYQALMNRVRDAKYAIQFRLQPGEMVAFDNKRILHGRKAFDVASGERHYQGFYIEKNEIDNRIRVLSRNTCGAS